MSARAARLRVLVVAPVPALVLLEVAALRTPGYRHRADTVSALAAPGQPVAILARAVVAAYGLVVLAAARDLGDLVSHRRRWVVGAVAMCGSGVVVAGLSPKVLTGQPTTTASTVHVAAALASGAALLVAMAVVARWGRSTTEQAVALVALVLSAAATIAFRQTWGTDVYGLAERLALGAGVAWLSWSAWCARRLRPRR